MGWYIGYDSASIMHFDNLYLASFEQASRSLYLEVLFEERECNSFFVIIY